MDFWQIVLVFLLIIPAIWIATLVWSVAVWIVAMVVSTIVAAVSWIIEKVKGE